MKVRFAVGPTGGLLRGPEIIGFADALEASGFDGLWLSDLPVRAVIDPLLGLALIAGRTTRLKLGANVVPLGRNPFLLAKSLAQLDQLSRGRLLLSFVPGLGEPGEREVLDWQGASRGAALEDVLATVRAWWSGERRADQLSAEPALDAVVRRSLPNPVTGLALLSAATATVAAELGGLVHDPRRPLRFRGL